MRIAVLDSTAVVRTGPGSPAYFSRFVLQRLQAQGHEIIYAPNFDEDLCGEADLVLCEWANREAFDAAASGVCKRLVIRCRGFDAHGPLDKLRWENVDALVYESEFLRQYVGERFATLGGVPREREHVLASGIDVAGVPYDGPIDYDPPVIALVARTTSDKGYQLAFEWARQRPDVQLHVTTALSETSPRLAAYLAHTKPDNVTIHGTVDTVKWLGGIGANYILSCSIWETLGYTIAEGMAAGCKPLIHDAPGTSANWPKQWLWRSFDDLDKLLANTSFAEADDYRAYAEEHFDEHRLSQQFIDLIESIPARNADVYETRYAFERSVLKVAQEVRDDATRDIGAAAALVEEYRRRWPVHDRFAEFRYMAACDIAAAYAAREKLGNAAMWACRALLDSPWPDAMCLLGEIADLREDAEQAAAWYQAACAVDDPPKRFRMGLVDRKEARLDELMKKAYLLPVAAPVKPPERFAVVVTVRNAEKWIAACLTSIAVQSYPLRCVVIDDVSTDRTASIAREFAKDDPRFVVVENTERKYQARNTVEGARLATDQPEDVVVLVDGDDRLGGNALEVIAERYTHGAWMTYGNFVTSDGKPSHFGPYPRRIAQAGAFADWSWQATAPRTFKRFLLDYVTDDDFKTKSGEWPKVAGDVSLLLPLLEMSCERALPITDAIYTYNTETPDSDHKQDAYEQVRVRDVLMARPRKLRLERP